MRHYEFTKKGVQSFCFGEEDLAEALASGATDVKDFGHVYFFRDRHGFPTWVSDGMSPGVWGDISEEGYEEVMSH